MKLSKYILAFVSLLSFNACSDDFITAVSPDQIPIEEYYSTEARIFEALVASYAPLQWPDWNGSEYNPSLIMSDIMADDFWVGGAGHSDNMEWHLMANFEALPERVIKGVWSCYYSGVNRANNVIEYMDYVKNISSENRALYIAEAKVLRSFYFTYLWKMWGNIPYHKKNLEFPYIGEQYTADRVYAEIIEDLDEAIQYGNLPMKASSSDYGRVTKAMTYMLYAEVVMYQRDETRYAKALEYMQEIISSKQYELHSDYGKIFEQEGEWCKESIWEVNFKSEGAVRSWNGPLVSGGTVLPRLIGPNGWFDGNDNRDNGWGFCPLRKEAFELFESDDLRRDATVFDATDKTYNRRFQDTGYWLNKYMARTGYNTGQLADGDLNYNNNLRIYRYAETLLNAAELIKLGAGSGDADGMLNEVRTRAGLPVSAATIDNIIEERRLEFMGEGKRYWDLIRTGKAASTLVPDEYNYRTRTWTENKKWLPIAQSEVNASQGAIKQNNY